MKAHQKEAQSGHTSFFLEGIFKTLAKKTGMTFVELIVAVAIFSGLGLAVMQLIRSSRLGYSQSLRNNQQNVQMRKTVMEITKDLRYAAATNVALQESYYDSHDILTFQVPISVTDGTTNYGYDGTIGYKCQYTVSGDSLVRHIQDANDVTQSTTVLLDNLDTERDWNEASGYQKGFDVNRIPSWETYTDLYQINIRVSNTPADGTSAYESTQSVTIHLRN